MLLDELIIPIKADSKGFNNVIKGVTAGIGAVVAVAGLAIKATFKWADELDSLGDVMGVTKKQAAAMNFVLRKSGTDTDTFAQGMTILEKNLVKANGQLDTTGKTLKTWGINVFDANHHLKDQATLVDEISTKYNSFSTQQERVNFLTEVFGKSGAKLVDFFDTMAQEGGIDKVTKKVEAFGLAIDPNRYEQFNRNIEELKLIGLGLAVSFTEKVMPQLEKFLGWITKVAESPDFKKIKDQVSGMLDGIFGGGQAGGTKFDLKNVDQVVKTDQWEAAGTAIGNAIGKGAQAIISPEFWTKLTTPPEGLGDKIASFLEGLTGISRTVQPGSDQDPISNMVRGWGKSLDTWFKTTQSKIDEFWGTISATVSTKMDGIKNTMFGKAVLWAIALWQGIQLAPILIGQAIATFAITVDGKLRDISKTFFNAAVRWTAQMKAGFMDGISDLLSIVHGLVESINKVLNGIITSFKINISSNAVQLSGGTIVHPTAPDKTKDDKANAMGGSFRIPSAYGYEGFNLGQLGTASGGEAVRITPRGQANQANVVELSEGSINRLAERLGVIIPSATIKAMNNV